MNKKEEKNKIGEVYKGEILIKKFETKKERQFIIELDGIDSFSWMSLTRPQLTSNNSNKNKRLYGILYSIINPNTELQLREWMLSSTLAGKAKLKNKYFKLSLPLPAEFNSKYRNLNILFMDPTGLIISKTKYTGVTLEFVNFSECNYDTAETSKIYIEMSFKTEDYEC